jgi:hypothetical protein
VYGVKYGTRNGELGIESGENESGKILCKNNNFINKFCQMGR